MNWGHRKQETARSIPLVSCDCLYITTNRIFGREELSDDERKGSSRVLVMYCARSRIARIILRLRVRNHLRRLVMRARQIDGKCSAAVQ